MARKQFKRIVRATTEDEKKRHAKARRLVMQEFPPAKHGGKKPGPPGDPPAEPGAEG